MNKSRFTLAFMLMFSLGLQGQTTSPVTNVITQVSQDRDKVTVTYDLARKPGVSNYNVAIRITLDGELVNAQAISGDVGPNIVPGYGKRIIWDVLKDLSELYGSLQVEVTAKSNQPDCIPIKTVPVYAGLGGVAATGFALGLSGLKMESDSKDLYDIYKNNINPNDPVFSETSREDYYQEANKKHKTGTWLMIGGGTVIVAGGIMMVSRLIQINKYNKNCAGRSSDAMSHPRVSPLFLVNSDQMSTGIAITF
jgi:hypothetical protein